MAETIRSYDDFVNAITGIWRDNSAAEISEQDGRDMIASVYAAKHHVAKTSAYSVAQGEPAVEIDASGGAVTITLPTPANGEHHGVVQETWLDGTH